MFVSEIMSTCVAECTEDTELERVYELIKKCDHGLVIVIDSEAHRVPIGVVSERSICEQIIARGRNPKGLRAGSVLDSRIKTLRETDAVDSLDVSALDSLAAVIATNSQRQALGLVPKEKLRGISSVATQSAGRVLVNTSSQPSQGVPAIPRLGWVN